MVLSLIATIFLPVTFFTGVYGMNFQEDGGYTIGMVNSPQGPLIFYCMCISVLLISCAYFFSMGWIELYPIYRYFLSLCFGDRRVQEWERDGEVGSFAKNEAMPSSVNLSGDPSTNPLNYSLSSLDSISVTSPPLSSQGTPVLTGRGTFAGRGSTVGLPRDTIVALDEEERRRLATIRKRHQVKVSFIWLAVYLTRVHLVHAAAFHSKQVLFSPFIVPVFIWCGTSCSCITRRQRKGAIVYCIFHEQLR
jgi:hypothetical protein